MRTLVCISLVLVTTLLADQPPTSQPATAPISRPDAVRVVKLTITPAAEPRPALKYLLLPDLVAQSPGNAADLYQVAAMLMMEKPYRDVRDGCDEWQMLPLGQFPKEEVKKTLREYQGALRYVELASRREYCHWERPMRTLGYDVELPALSKLRPVAVLLALQARLQIFEGQFEHAAETLKTGFAMTRHVADVAGGSLIVESLVALGCSDPMVPQLEAWIGRPGAPNLYWALTLLRPPFVDIQSGVETEWAVLFWNFPPLKDLDQAHYPSQQWEGMVTNTIERIRAFVGGEPCADWGPTKLGVKAWLTAAYPEAKKRLTAAGRTPAQVETMRPAQAILTAAVAGWTEYFHQQIKWMAVPFREAREPLKALDKARKTSSRSHVEELFLRPLAPLLLKVYYQTTRFDRRIAALRCIEAIRLHAVAHGKLPASLADVTDVPVPLDPMTGAGFPYKLVGDTATLDVPPEPDWPLRDATHYELKLAH